MTNAQLQAIKAAVAGDPALSGFANTPDGNFEVAVLLNQAAVPDFWVWRTSVTVSEIYESTTADGTAWSWPAFISRNQGERDGWRAMVNSGAINPSLSNVRAGVSDIFSGAAGAAQRTHLLAIGRRRATRSEKILATGPGTTAAPATMTFEGNLTHSDVQQARDLP